MANSSQSAILSLDTPSGTGHGRESRLCPTCARPQPRRYRLPRSKGYCSPDALAACGDLYLCIQRAAGTLRHLGLDVPPLFAPSTIRPLT
ncbi:MAG: hypothetical protein R2854_15900 [Caldilineaceae bacterium]